METIHYFLKRYAEHMNKPASEEIERQVAEYERGLREQLAREQQFAELAARQREQHVPAKLLPVLGQSSGSPTVHAS